mmetsp:Transcript_65863/g.129829  ORF Transcript_65863/g.129829 Transcript_65863/m.129829 type:complete len:92 (-) Transcript_65863:73-348(-)
MSPHRLDCASSLNVQNSQALTSPHRIALHEAASWIGKTKMNYMLCMARTQSVVMPSGLLSVAKNPTTDIIVAKPIRSHSATCSFDVTLPSK